MGKDSALPGFGYPDMGAGRYSRKLPYADWFKFNCAQRIHMNSIEHLAWSIPVLLVGGMFLPKFCALMGATVLVGRELYRYGYMTEDGPNSWIREAGAIPLNVAELMLMLSIGFLAARYFCGPFFNNRNFVRRFTMSKYDKKYEDVL